MTTILAVMFFGSIGGILRFALGASPFALIAVNTVGAFAFGLFMNGIRSGDGEHWMHNGIATGLIGSFTTFSSFLMDTLQLMQTRPVLGLVYMVGTVVGGLGGCLLGIGLANVLQSRALSDQPGEDDKYA